MSDPPIIFGQPFLDEEEIDLVADTLRSGWIGQGPLVQRFEDEFATYVGADHTVAVSSCTAAIELSLRSAGIGSGDTVITTPLTFVATINAIESTGAVARLVDVGEDLLITPAAAAAAWDETVRAVVPVSFGGRPLDLHGFCQLADDRAGWVIEDAAHSIGGVAQGHRVGASRHQRLLTCFSFYPNKNLSSAEGGAITLSDESMAMELKSLRLHGLSADAWDRYRTKRFHPSMADMAGHKANWTDVQAAIALPQLKKLEGMLAVREHLATRYDELFAEIDGVRTLTRRPSSLNSRHALHLYQVRVAATRRDSLVADLRSDGIGAAVHYPAIFEHPYFERLGSAHDFPLAASAAQELLTLPLHPGLGEADVYRVVSALNRRLK